MQMHQKKRTYRSNLRKPETQTKTGLVFRQDAGEQKRSRPKTSKAP